jgi:lipoic acid synthetase/lipoate-protein ligase A
MRWLRMPEGDSDSGRRLVFWLALEEWAVVNAPGSLFVWSVDPTVIFGRNQDMEAEVNVPYCREHSIQMYRRKSGGGCVYADGGNLMISYITSEPDVNRAFDAYLSSLASALRGMGLEAVRTEHNDVLVAGRKVSGNACYATPTGCIVHGTLLYDTDFTEMERAITPSKEKLDSKGIKSVRQRVANLKEFGVDFSFDDLRSRVVDYFCDDTQVMTTAQLAEVLETEKTYLDENFIKYGRRN